MKMPVAVWPVIVVLLTACHEESPTGPDMTAVDMRAASVHLSGIQQVSAGDYHACSLDATGAVACWGSDRYGQASPVDGRFVQVSAGESHTCALARGGTVACWGTNYAGESAPPNGSFSEVSVGDGLSCGVRRDGAVVCWGYSDLGDQTTVPDGRYAHVTVAAGYACALRRNATAVCWGWYPGSEVDAQPAGDFAQIDAGNSGVCGLRPDGTLTCWDGQAHSTPLAGVFTDVSVGWNHACAVAADGTVGCWGNDDAGQSTPPGGPFTQVSAGRRYTCGARTNGTSVCWGDVPVYVPPVYTLVPVSVSGSGTMIDAAGHRLHFGLHVTLDPEQGASPTGTIRFRVPDAGITFASTVIYTMQVSGDAVVIRGAGRADLGSHERLVDFVITGVDGGTAGADAFRAQLWTDEFNALEYDSGSDALPGDAGTPLENGTVTIRTDVK